MSVKTMVKLSVVFLVMVFPLLSFSTVKAGAPYGPNLTSPPDGSTSSGNPPTLCANQGQGDPDGQSVQIRFEAHAGGADHISGWLNVDGSGNVCWTDSVPWSPGTFAWQARSLAGGEQSGASPEWKVTVPAPPQPTQPPGQPTQPPQQNESCWVSTMSPNPPAPVQIGTTVVFTVGAKCDTGVNRIDIVKDGGVVYKISGESGKWSWNTSGEWQGNHVINAVAYGNSGGVASKSHPYDLSVSPPPQSSGGGSSNTPSFANGSLIRGREGRIYIMIHGERRWIPNPDTFYALGLKWENINNRGVSEDQVETLPRGGDVPDVNRDKAGFEAFKKQYAAYLSGGNQGGSGGNTTTDNSCPSAPQKVQPGKLAVVNNWDNEPLVVRHDSRTSSSIKFKVPVYGKVSIISGPRCGEGRRWFEVGYQGNSGWAVEISTYGATYNIIPDGEPLSGPGGSGGGGNSQASTTTPQGPTNVDDSAKPGETCNTANYGGLKVGKWGTTGKRIDIWLYAGGLTNRLGEIPYGGVFEVVDGPVCVQTERGYFIWWQVKYTHMTGWITPGYPYESHLRVTNPPPDESPGAQQTEVEPTIAPPPWPFNLAPEVEAFTAWGPCECTALVDKEWGSDLDMWLQRGNAHEWDNTACDSVDAKNAGITVSIGDARLAQIGDIIVWNQSCGGPYSSAGHVGLVLNTNPSSNEVTVRERNWDGNANTCEDDRIHTYTVKSCMSFIHKPNQGKDNSFCTGVVSTPKPETSTQNQVSKCSPPANWWDGILCWLGLLK